MKARTATEYARLITVYVISNGQCYGKKIHKMMYLLIYIFSPGTKLKIKRQLLRS